MPKWHIYGLPIPQTLGPRGQLPGAGAQPVGSGDDRFAFRMPSPTYLGPDRQLPGTGTQPVKIGNDRFMFGMLSPTYPGPSRQRPVGGTQPVKPASDRFAFGMPTRRIRDQMHSYCVPRHSLGSTGLEMTCLI